MGRRLEHRESSFDRDEKAFVKAYEVNGKILQFEGNWITMALVVNSVFVGRE